MDDLNKFDITPDIDIGDKSIEFVSENFIGGTEGVLDMLERDPEMDKYDIPDITEVPYEEETEEQTNSDSEVTNWSISLADVPTALKISEYGQTYIYGRLVDPDGTPSNKFSGFYRNDTKEGSKWQSLPGVLSEKYTVVSLEKFVTTVVKEQFETVLDDPLQSKEPWRSVWLGTCTGRKYSIKYLDQNTTALLIFKHIAGEDIAINNISSRLGYVITNTYNGTNKLKFGPIVKTICNNLVFNDFFTFCNFTQEISHGAKDANFTDNLSIIKENIVDHITVLKNYRNTNPMFDEILKCFKKPGRDEFLKIIHTEIPGVDIEDNIFHILICASIALYKNYSVIEHVAIRSKVMAFLDQIF